MCVASPITSSSSSSKPLFRRSSTTSSHPYKRQASMLHSSSSSSLSSLSICAPPLHKRAQHSQPPPCHSKSSRRRRVSFSTSSSLHIIDNLTIHYKTDLWLTSDEIDKTKRKTTLFAHLLRCGTLNKDDFDKVLLMGLEKHLYQHEHDGDDADGSASSHHHHGSSSSSSSSRERQQLFDAVLQEQGRQTLLRIHDVEALAMISRLNSQKARDRARIIGMLHSTL